jgi:hypothetical protein
MQLAWVTRQITVLLSQFSAKSGNAAWIGISDKEMLAPIDYTVPRRAPFRLGGGYLPGIDPGLKGGFVWQPDKSGEPELWLPPAQSQWRDVFEYFARRYLRAPGLSAAHVQIDHVFPKKAAVLDGLAYVRMLAVPPDSNMAAGRTVERAMAERASVMPRGKLVRLATYYSIGKACGFSNYNALPDSSDANANLPVVRSLFAFLKGLGLPPDVLTTLDAKLTADTLTTHR